jgi:hypothetical protein
VPREIRVLQLEIMSATADTAPSESTMNSILKRVRSLKDRDLYRLSEAIDLEFQRRLESRAVEMELVDESSTRGDESSVIPMPGIGNVGPLRAA